MKRIIFSICKWLVIICFFPAIILSSLNVINEFWLHYDWGKNVGIWGAYFLKVLAASFCLALLIGYPDKEADEEETDK